MRESLFEYGKNNFVNNDEEKSNNKKQNKSFDNIEKNLNQEAKGIFDKYKNYSKDELLSEFLTSTKKRLQDGSLSREQIDATVGVITPFLDENGRSVLKGLIDKIDD